MTINERVKRLREALGESQECFGTAIGISKSGVSNIESGIRNVTEKHIKLICMAYSVSEEWIRNGEEPMFIQDDSTIISQLAREYNLDVYEKAMISAFLKMKPEQRSFMKEWVKASMQEILESENAPADAAAPAAPAPVTAIKEGRESLEAAEKKTPFWNGDMTDEEAHAELDRELLDEKERAARLQASQSFGSVGENLA